MARRCGRGEPAGSSVVWTVHHSTSIPRHRPPLTATVSLVTSSRDSRDTDHLPSCRLLSPLSRPFAGLARTSIHGELPNPHKDITRHAFRECQSQRSQQATSHTYCYLSRRLSSENLASRQRNDGATHLGRARRGLGGGGTRMKTNLIAGRVEEVFQHDDVAVRQSSHYLQLPVLKQTQQR